MIGRSSLRNAALGLVPFAAVALAARVAVPGIGDAIGRSLASCMRVVVERPVARAPTIGATTDVDPDASPDPPLQLVSVVETSDRRREPAREKDAKGEARASALTIPAERVARLTERDLRGIGATTVTDAQGRPVGVSLSGVGRLGLGLADGDVVTSIEGRATSTVEDGTAAAFGAYASGARAAHATLSRGGRKIVVTVGIPRGRAGGGANL